MCRKRRGEPDGLIFRGTPPNTPEEKGGAIVVLRFRGGLFRHRARGLRGEQPSSPDVRKRDPGEYDNPSCKIVSKTISVILCHMLFLILGRKYCIM